jgi:hypothetical protein
MMPIEAGDVLRHRKLGIVVKVISIEHGGVYYRVISHTNKPEGYLGTANLSKVLEAVKSGKYKVDETTRVSNILKQYNE